MVELRYVTTIPRLLRLLHGYHWLINSGGEKRDLGLGLGDLRHSGPVPGPVPALALRQPTRGTSGSDSSESNSLGLEGVEIPGSMAPDCDPDTTV